MTDDTSDASFSRLLVNDVDARPRRSSLPISWDHTMYHQASSMVDASCHGEDEFQVPSSAADSTNGSIFTDSNTNHSTMAASLLELHNPDFAQVNKTVANTLLDMLRNVRRKLGEALETPEECAQAYRTLSAVPPFSYLPNQVTYDLVHTNGDLHKIQYSDGEVIVQQGQRDHDVYILAQGRVVMVQLLTDRSSDNLVVGNGTVGAKFVGYLDAPAHFGEWGTLFETRRHAQVIAGVNPVVVYRMSGQRFEALLHHAAFRLKLATSLRQNGIFAEIERFVAVVRRAVAQDDSFDFDSILACYRKMVPAIHANLHSAELDVEGWTYAVRRLPETITSTYVYLLSRNVPMPFMHPNCDLKSIHVETVGRRRHAFALDHGKLLVVLREKFSDALDFLSMLCCHIHECAKLRTKLTTPSTLDVIHQCLWRKEDGGRTGYHRFARQQTQTASVEEQRLALERLPLTAKEREGLQALWPKDFLYRIFDIICMHENIQVRSDLNASVVENTDRWAESIRHVAAELLERNHQGQATTKDTGGGICLRTDVTTHIISSNTTSVRNLLSPYILKHKTVIRSWGSETHPEIIGSSDLSESDKLYALSNAYMKHHPIARAEQDAFDAKCFKTLRNTELTGIQVELIDLNALQQVYSEHDLEPDPFLVGCFPGYTPGQGWKATTDSSGRRGRLLVNIDYAFGKQGEQLISALALLFGTSLASVGIMGKAGGLQGRRGDIIVADYLVHQDGDEHTPIDNTGVDRTALQTLSKRNVHSGGVLTVLGTLLQDTRLLYFYKKLHGCVSLEMEGSFYAKELQRYKQAGLLSNDVKLRFLYYVSDTPLSTDQTETLSQDLSIAEVIPPQYAVTRALLHPVLMESTPVSKALPTFPTRNCWRTVATAAIKSKRRRRNILSLSSWLGLAGILLVKPCACTAFVTAPASRSLSQVLRGNDKTSPLALVRQYTTSSNDDANNKINYKEMNREFLAIAAPAFCQLAAEPLASLVDTAYLGRLGPEVLGGAGVAVSAHYAIAKLYNDPLLRTSISLVAQQDGKQRGKPQDAATAKQELSRAVSSALLLAAVVGVIQLVVYAIFCRSITMGMGLTTTSPMWHSALSYMQIRALGTPAATLWLVANGIFRGLGDTKTPLIYSLIFTALNAILDPLFIFTFHWGASGAAAGTALAQYMALIPLLRALNAKVPIRILGQFKELTASLESYLSAGGLVLVRTFGKVLAYSVCARHAAVLGSVAAAAYNLTFQLGFATTQICEAVAVAVQTLLARDLADKTTSILRLKHWIRLSIGIGGGVATALSLTTWWRRQWTVAALTTNPAVQAAALSIFPAVLLTQVLKGLAYPVNGMVMGGVDWTFSAIVMWMGNALCVGWMATWQYFNKGAMVPLVQIWWALAMFMGVQVVAGLIRVQSKTGPWTVLKEKESSQ